MTPGGIAILAWLALATGIQIGLWLGEKPENFLRGDAETRSADDIDWDNAA